MTAQDPEAVAAGEPNAICMRHTEVRRLEHASAVRSRGKVASKRQQVSLQLPPDRLSRSGSTGNLV